MMEKAKEALREQIGQDRVMALATRNGGGVAVRTVNVYTYDGCFYFITEEDSNKYQQIAENNNVALSVDAVQIAGTAAPLGHPADEANKSFIGFVEKQLPHRFDCYAAKPVMRLVRVEPSHAGFIALDTGAGYVIDFAKGTAAPIRLEM